LPPTPGAVSCVAANTRKEYPVANHPTTLQPTQFRTTRQGVRDLDDIHGAFVPATFDTAATATGGRNVAEVERSLSVMGGVALLGAALAARGVVGLLMGLAGGAMVYRGLTGHCQIYQALGINTAEGTNRGTEMVYRQ
jgi:hypothetical protein